MGEALEGTGGWRETMDGAQERKMVIEGVGLNGGEQRQLKNQVDDLQGRLERLEDLLPNSNPLAAFGGGREVGPSLWDENARLVAENHQLRDALADVHRNAEAVVLLSKLAMGEG